MRLHLLLHNILNQLIKSIENSVTHSLKFWNVTLTFFHVLILYLSVQQITCRHSVLVQPLRFSLCIKIHSSISCKNRNMRIFNFAALINQFNYCDLFSLTSELYVHIELLLTSFLYVSSKVLSSSMQILYEILTYCSACTSRFSVI